MGLFAGDSLDLYLIGVVPDPYSSLVKYRDMENFLVVLFQENRLFVGVHANLCKETKSEKKSLNISIYECAMYIDVNMSVHSATLPLKLEYKY